MTGFRSKMKKLFQELSATRSLWTPFEDFLKIMSLAISNSVDLAQYEAREAEYLKIIGGYGSDEVQMFCELAALLTQELEANKDEFRDVLGELFHELEFHNKFKGQYFTPYHVAQAMGKIVVNELPEKDYITICEPACGSGVMVLGVINALRERKDTRPVFVEAFDVDPKCAAMCYIQLSLYGIAAVVHHANTLTLEEWSRWYTPAYILDNWAFRLKYGTYEYPTELGAQIKEDLGAMIDGAMELAEKVMPEPKQLSFGV